ncbi:flagellar motor protein MotB [Paenibacillus senegalensis]|uniref:flagellar motor protein MotB n=1 Tax=Paenibacillus senegalensis TaxID=1465766 RepID=UPI000289F63B|nr:flagellar motor protein MotB [Paenibacillus senegalensis]
MARRGRGSHKVVEAENHERWMVSYADFITLLLIFFIVLYAMSKVDVDKYNALAQSLNFQFSGAESPIQGGNGVLDAWKPTEVQQFYSDSRDLENDREKGLRDLTAEINEYIEQHGLEASVYVSNTPRGVAITLNDLFLFDLGRADLKEPAYPILEKLASLFPTLDTHISIEGHTDDIPLATGSYYKDNWRLSSERSLSVLRYFTNEANLPESMFISTAYADTKPVVPNTSDENRQKNRRVEIVVLR